MARSHHLCLLPKLKRREHAALPSMSKYLTLSRSPTLSGLLLPISADSLGRLDPVCSTALSPTTRPEASPEPALFSPKATLWIG